MEANSLVFPVVDSAMLGEPGERKEASHGRRILVVEDEPLPRQILAAFLKKEGYEPLVASSYQEALLVTALERPEVVLSDIQLGEQSGLELQAKLNELQPDLAVILITAADHDFSLTVQAMQQGAYDYLTKPIDFERLRLILRHLFETQSLSQKLSIIVSQEAKEYELSNVLVGRSTGMINIYKTIGSVSRSQVTVLIQGESGTGKELIARAIHFNSLWREEPFVAVNCTALTETLLESELFGHVKGSFTGAQTDKLGKFELAGSGTIFLDEIGEISASVQVKLLRIIQQREFERVGAPEKPVPMRARIVAATNRDLAEEVKKGRFREDLYYRLNVVSVQVPPLRERKDDLPMIVKHLIRKINDELHTSVLKLSEGAMNRILEHDWPGNVRELENILVRAIVLSKTDMVQEDLLPEPKKLGAVSTGAPAAAQAEIELNWRRTLDDVEMEHILRVLRNVGGNRTEAARVLGISKQTLYSKLQRDAKSVV